MADAMTNGHTAEGGRGPASSSAQHAFAVGQLRSIVERIERLEEEKAALAADIKEVFAEAKGQGFEVKTLRQVLKLRKMDKADRQEQEALLELYLEALGE